MNLFDMLPPLRGYLEIIVKDHYTGEILRHDKGPNQVQDWARHAITYLIAGRLFCTWGNHGEQVSDAGTPYTISHYKDGKDGTEIGDIITGSPWVYSSAFDGLIQLRTKDDGDQIGGTTTNNTPLYPFFPTKMRFGIGGLNADQNPLTNVPTSQTNLNTVNASFPFVVIDRQRSADSHIQLSEGLISAISNTTFSCKLPGGDPDYPYNGKVISEAGLFCDAALVPTTSSPNKDYNMRTGIMFAYRTFYGITKNESIDIIFNWTFKS